MIENIQVTSVFANPTKAGKDRWTAETNLGQMQVWDKEVADSLDKHKGKWLEVETAKSADNKFTNLKLVRGIAEIKPREASSWNEQPKVNFVDANKELNNRRIVRQAAIYQAIAFFKDGVEKVSSDDVLSLAKKFEDWVYREDNEDGS